MPQPPTEWRHPLPFGRKLASALWATSATGAIFPWGTRSCPITLDGAPPARPSGNTLRMRHAPDGEACLTCTPSSSRFQARPRTAASQASRAAGCPRKQRGEPANVPTPPGRRRSAVPCYISLSRELPRHIKWENVPTSSLRTPRATGVDACLCYTWLAATFPSRRTPFNNKCSEHRHIVRELFLFRIPDAAACLWKRFPAIIGAHPLTTCFRRLL